LMVANDPLLTFVPTVIPDLTAATDSGVSNSDNVTAALNVTFAGNIDAAAAGAARVWLFVDGIAKSLNVALPPGSTSYNMTIPLPADGWHNVTLKMQYNQSISHANYPASPVLALFSDKAAPVMTITPVTPDPRKSTVNAIGISFDRPVSGFDVADLQLKLNGGSNRLTFATSSPVLTNVGGSNQYFLLEHITNTTMWYGNYSLTFTASGSGVMGRGASIAATANATETWVQQFATYQNPFRYLDVNNDGSITAIDANRIATAINQFGPGPLPGPYTNPFYLDVNGDGLVTSDDFDAVMAFLNGGYSAGPYWL
jgi:hypothetical protein